MHVVVLLSGSTFQLRREEVDPRGVGYWGSIPLKRAPGVFN